VYKIYAALPELEWAQMILFGCSSVWPKPLTLALDWRRRQQNSQSTAAIDTLQTVS
jgi:hypothetical protein